MLRWEAEVLTLDGLLVMILGENKWFWSSYEAAKLRMSGAYDSNNVLIKPFYSLHNLD